MKIVIDISEKAYNLISGKIDIANIDLYSTLIQAVKNGTPLPKGHGDLKDISEIKRLWQKGDYDSIVSALLFAPTVIEADKEIENESNRMPD